MQEKKLTKEDAKTFSKAIKIASNTEVVESVQVTDEKGFTYWRPKKYTAVQKLADQIIQMALDPDTPLKEKVMVFEKMAKVAEGETKNQNTNINVGIAGSYEEFLLKAEEQRKMIEVKPND